MWPVPDGVCATPPQSVAHGSVASCVALSERCHLFIACEGCSLEVCDRCDSRVPCGGGQAHRNRKCAVKVVHIFSLALVTVGSYHELDMYGDFWFTLIGMSVLSRSC